MDERQNLCGGTGRTCLKEQQNWHKRNIHPFYGTLKYFFEMKHQLFIFFQWVAEAPPKIGAILGDTFDGKYFQSRLFFICLFAGSNHLANLLKGWICLLGLGLWLWHCLLYVEFWLKFVCFIEDAFDLWLMHCVCNWTAAY